MPSMDYEIATLTGSYFPRDRCVCGRVKMARSARCWHCQTTWPNRFWLKVERSDTCWLWKAQIDAYGYGIVSHGGKNKKAHRVSWEMVYGPIPAGLTIDHLCLTKSCVNPSHMELVTFGENTARYHRRKRITS